jgi:hypothetical protein
MYYQDDEESIYDLIPRSAPEPPKPRRHKSKYPSEAPPTASTFGSANMGGDYTPNVVKKPSATFGKKSYKSNPAGFLRKDATTKKLPEAKKFTRQTAKLKPQVVKASDRPVFKRNEKTNFIKENAMAAIMAQPPKRKEDLNYLKKEDYGKVPEYLEHVKREVAAEQEYIQSQMMEQQPYSSQPQVIPEAERLQILNNLKQKWEEVNNKYQQLTHLTVLDNMKKDRKQTYEAELTSLEKAIEKMSKQYCFVEVDNYGY